MTYEYLVEATGQVVTVEQRITEDAHEFLEIDGQMYRVKRLIAGAPGFHLIDGPSGSWASGGYAVPLNKRKLDARLGNK